MNNAQLDNEKQTYRYQVDILKDQFEEMEEAHVELQREHKDRCRVSNTNILLLYIIYMYSRHTQS